MWGEGDHNLIVDDDKVVSQKDTVFYTIFASMMTARKSCMNCQFAKVERIADFTAADFHGYKCLDYNKGVSLVIANNEKAIEILNSTTGLQTIPETWVKALNSNHRLYNGYDLLQHHPAVIFRKQLYKTSIFKKFCLNKGFYRLLWLPFKAVTKTVIKIKAKSVIKKAYTLDNMK